MRMKLLYGTVALLALAAGVATQHWLVTDSAPPPPAAASHPAQPAEPAIVEPPLRDLDGQPHTLAEWRGKVVVLNFWATWCGPCREEMPEFVRLQNELGEQGLQFVGVAIDEADAVRDYLKETPVNYPILMGDEHAPDWSERLGNKLAGLPFSVVFDREGRKIHAMTGAFKREDILRVIKPLLAKPAASH